MLGNRFQPNIKACWKNNHRARYYRQSKALQQNLFRQTANLLCVCVSGAITKESGWNHLYTWETRSVITYSRYCTPALINIIEIQHLPPPPPPHWFHLWSFPVIVAKDTDSTALQVIQIRWESCSWMIIETHLRWLGTGFAVSTWLRLAVLPLQVQWETEDITHWLSTMTWSHILVPLMK